MSGGRTVVRGLLAIAGLAAATPRSHAGPDRTVPADLSLRDAVAIAIGENPRLGMATMTAVTADAAVVGAAGAYDATLDATASAAVVRSDPNQTPYAQDLEQDQLAASVAIQKRMLRGATVVLRLVGAYTRRTSQIPAQTARAIVDQTSIAPRVELEWVEPLIGGRRSGRAERRGLTAAADAAASERRAEAARVVRDVERGYWQLYLAERTVEIQRAGLALAADQLALVQAEIANGAQPRQAAAEVEEELGRRQEDVLIAEGAVIERSLELARLLGRPAVTDLHAGEAPPETWSAPTADEVAAAVERAPAVAAAVARGDEAAAAVDRVDDDTGWRVDGYVRASATAESGQVADALTRAAGYGGVTAEVGVTVRLPLGDRTRRGRLDGARAALVRARMQVVDTEAELAAAVTRERNRLDVAAQRRTALARSIELAETNLAAEQRRWKRGDSTSFEVLRRQASLADVRLRAVRALVDALDARAGLEALTGALLARHGVEL